MPHELRIADAGLSLARRAANGAACAALLALAVLTTAGCNLLPLGLRRKPPQEDVKRRFGVTDDRIKVMDIKDLDAEMAQPRSGLRLIIRADKERYYIGDPIIVDVRLENVAPSRGEQGVPDLSVYFEPVAQERGSPPMEWLFNFLIRCEDDEKLIYRSPKVTVPDKDLANYYHYVTLPPQSYVGRTFVFLPSRAPGLMKSGRYSLLASYTVGDDFGLVILNRNLTNSQIELLGTGLAYVRVWTGQVHSNRAEFRIARKKRFLFF